MTTTHTPGPWTITDGQNHRVYLINHGRDAVGETVYTDTRNPADARLIAAAPDLLAALKNILREHDALQMAEGRTGDRWPATTRARAAIAKATGEA